MRQQGIDGLRGVHAGSCHAWPLPADATCATVARRVFRDAVSEVGLEPDRLDDCILMASELAASTPHARAAAGTGGGGDRFVSVAPDMGGEPISSAGPAPHTPREGAAWPGAVPGCPELWLYLRGLATRRELVCKVFDCYRGWRHGSAPSAARVPAQSVTGRGLQVVHELSRGRWGHHLTRARLGGWGVRGCRRTRSRPTSPPRPGRASASAPARRPGSSRRCWTSGGSEAGWYGADQPASDMSVLSVCRGLTVWCRSGVVSLTSPEGGRVSPPPGPDRVGQVLSGPRPRPPARRCPA